MLDVGIVGAGPAGCAAAKILAENGFKVAIFEKEKLPREKQCGGGISLGNMNSFYKLDINIEEVALNEYKGFVLSYGDIKARSDLGRTIGWGVYRRDFDYLLAKTAISNGAQIVNEEVKGIIDEDGKMKIFTNSGVHEAKIVFGADGLRSIVRKGLDIPYQKERIGFCLVTEVKTPNDNIERFNDLLHLDFSNLKDGYSWIFPKKQGNTLNVGTGGYLRSIQNLDFPIKDLLINFARFYDIPIDVRAIHGALLPFGGTVDIFGKDNSILLGDAAGFASPLTGEGIPYALESGIIAADCATKSFENQIPLVELYTDAIKHLAREINDHALTLQHRLFGSDTHRRHVVERCATNDYLIETISKIFTHIIPYEEGVKRLSPLKVLTLSLRVW